MDIDLEFTFDDRTFSDMLMEDLLDLSEKVSVETTDDAIIIHAETDAAKMKITKSLINNKVVVEAE